MQMINEGLFQNPEESLHLNKQYENTVYVSISVLYNYWIFLVHARFC